MHEINWTDELFDIKQASNYHLSIQIGLDGFSFCMLDTLRNRYVAFQHIPLVVGKLQFLPRKIETIFDQEEKLGASFKKHCCNLLDQPKPRLYRKSIPKAISDQKIVSITCESVRNEDIRTDDISGFNYRLAYSLPNRDYVVAEPEIHRFQFPPQVGSTYLVNCKPAQRKEKHAALSTSKESISE